MATVALIVIERRVRLAAEEAWRRVTDWERHAAHVPLTTIILRTPPPTHVGTRFVARTGIGPLAFDDPMEVVHWDPPTAPDPHGLCRLEKRGTFVTGWAEIAVHRTGPDSSQVTWREQLALPWLPPPLARPTAWTARLLFTRVLTGLLSAPPTADEGRPH